MMMIIQMIKRGANSPDKNWTNRNNCNLMSENGAGTKY